MLDWSGQTDLPQGSPFLGGLALYFGGTFCSLGRCHTFARARSHKFPPVSADGKGSAFACLGYNDTKISENGGADRPDEENEQILVMNGFPRPHAQHCIFVFEEGFEHVDWTCVPPFRSSRSSCIHITHIANPVGMTVTGDATDLIRRQ